MSVAAACALAACSLATVAWAYLLAAHGSYWRTDQRLPASGREGEPAGGWPSVTAIVPARNDAAVLTETLPTLLAQEYPGTFRVILVDDDSSDGTASVAGQIGRTQGRLRIVSGRTPPPGWAGKVWAMQQGLGAAGDPTYVLFTDADISHAPGTVSRLVRAAVAGDRGLVSQMALLRAQTPAERLLVPAFVYFFAQLYPFRRVNRPGSGTAAAAGGCMLVRRDFLNAAGGLDRIRGARIDDVAFGRLLKRSAPPVRCWLGFTTDVRSCRAYPRLGEVWDMMARSAYTQLRYSPAALGGTLAGLLWLYALPPAAGLAGLGWLAAGGGLAAAVLAIVGLAGWLIMTVSYIPMQRLYRLTAWRAPLLPLVALLYAAMTADSARRYYLGRGGQWKGRTISGRQVAKADGGGQAQARWRSP